MVQTRATSVLSVKFTGTLRNELHEQIERYCSEHGFGLAQFVRMACANQLHRKPNDPPLARAPRGRPKAP